MPASEKTPVASTRETIPQHLLNRIENEWQQMRGVSPQAPRLLFRDADTSKG